METPTNNITYAFSTPILMQQYSNVNNINTSLEQSIREIQEYSESYNRGMAFKGGFFTNNLNFTEDFGGFKQFRSMIKHSVKDYIKQVINHEKSITGKLLIENISIRGWIEILQSGDYQIPHVNLDSMISGLYFIKVPGDISATNGCIDFLSPFESKELSFIKGARNSYARVIPQEGVLVMHPSYCKMYSHPFTSVGDLMMIKFNVTLDVNIA